MRANPRAGSDTVAGALSLAPRTRSGVHPVQAGLFLASSVACARTCRALHSHLDCNANAGTCRRHFVRRSDSGRISPSVNLGPSVNPPCFGYCYVKLSKMKAALLPLALALITAPVTLAGTTCPACTLIVGIVEQWWILHGGEALEGLHTDAPDGPLPLRVTPGPSLTTLSQRMRPCAVLSTSLTSAPCAGRS